jgi:preprotein translocase subunit SecE
MSSFINFFRESYTEVKDKVTWPTWTELLSSTNVVVIACLVLSLAIAVSDFGLNFLLREIIKALI